MCAHECFLHFFCCSRDWNISRGATLLKDLHIVDRGVTIKSTLMTVERPSDFIEERVARIKPTGTGKAVPVALGNDVGAGVKRAEVSRDDAIISGQ